jgi:CheY-like chemotaxis protein
MAMHGGQVRASSAGLGKGSTFVLTLPLVAESELQQEAQRRYADPLEALKSVRVMIVDDNQDAGRSLAALLEAEGHEVTVMVDPRSALEESETNFPQAFILDIGLPGMSGYELIKRLRFHPAAAQAIFIALTGYGQAQDRVLSKAAGFDHHFVKPVDPKDLAKIFAKLG